MIISEQGLVRAMKAAYKATGYTAYGLEEGIILFSNEWYVSIEEQAVPRKVLSTLIEHGGVLPHVAEALLMKKDQDAQVILPEDAADSIDRWTVGQPGEAVECLPIEVNGWTVFQSNGGAGACYAVPDCALGIVSDSQVFLRSFGRLLGEYKIVVVEQHQRVVLIAPRPATRYDRDGWDVRLFEAMEKVDLHRKRDKAEG